MNDQELIAIYREHAAELYRHVSRRIGADRELAEDIVQETWMRAVATWPRRGVPDNPPAWLGRVARNLLASHFRRIEPPTVPAEVIGLQDDRLSLDTPAAAALIHWGLSRLRRRQAALLEAFHLDGKSVRTIAGETGLSERAVEGRLRRARLALRRRLRPFASDSNPKSPQPRLTGDHNAQQA